MRIAWQGARRGAVGCRLQCLSIDSRPRRNVGRHVGLGHSGQVCCFEENAMAAYPYLQFLIPAGRGSAAHRIRCRGCTHRESRQKHHNQPSIPFVVEVDVPTQRAPMITAKI